MFIEPDDALEAQTPGGHSEPGDDNDEDGEAEGAIDEPAAELDRELEGEDDGRLRVLSTMKRMKTRAGTTLGITDMKTID